MKVMKNNPAESGTY